MGKKIYIVGCAHTGTTLLKRCFYAFKDTEVIVPEVTLDAFANRKLKSGFLVGKRTAKTIFSDVISPARLHRQLIRLVGSKVCVIYVYRAPADIRKAGVSSDRIDACFQQAASYGGMISMSLAYETLCMWPDRVQEMIVKLMGIEPEYDFSEYPVFVPDEEFESTDHVRDGDYSARPITTDRIAV